MADSKGFLISAYGAFWDRAEVDWKPGQGGKRQLLGHVGGNALTRRVCDFRTSAGFYVLWNDYRAVYVGMARGNEGIFNRLLDHTDKKDADWSRFSWFSTDTVVDDKKHDGWAVTTPRQRISSLSDESLVKEAEALLILTLGTYTTGYQNKMKFARASEWTQVTLADYAPWGLCRKVDAAPFSKRKFDLWDES
ncbi:hypothetical protein ABIE44_002768 [Marmoricola sp. OAE513]|uniref:hypothetical protein n=1 Tax=Marmoricola sp. OAE513 TaxID=2817894 RepID=UPI001AEB7FE8